MNTCCSEVSKLESKFYALEFHYIPQDYNVVADVLSMLGPSML